MHTSQAPTFANIMMRNETWLHNLTTFIRYTSWIYGGSVMGFCAHAKAKCLEESIVVFKFVGILTLLS
jgi:predicted membrane-bound mannosyltransferase